MRILLGSAIVAILLGSVHAQSCPGIPPLRPVMACSAGLQPLCLCGPNGSNCHWQWACPPSNAGGVRGTAPTETDPSIPLSYHSPDVPDPVETRRKIQEIRLMQQQTELLRQQTESVRRNNQIQEEDSLSGTDLGHYPDFPIANAYATMP